MPTHTSRTLKLCTDNGVTCGIVERSIPMKPFPIRKDLFGFIDIIGIYEKKHKIVGIQSCGMSFQAHKDKILIEKREIALEWLNAGGLIWLIGWRKVKLNRGGIRMIYKPRTLNITKDMFND